MYIRYSSSGCVCAEHWWAGSVSGRGSADTWLSESQRAARSFSLVKVNGRFFNLRERHRGREEAVRERERAKRDVSSAHALYSPQSTLPGQLQAVRAEPTTAIEKVLHACVCVCVYLLSLRFRTRSLVICPISSGRNSSLLDRSDITVTFLQLPIWSTRTREPSDRATVQHAASQMQTEEHWGSSSLH